MCPYACRITQVHYAGSGHLIWLECSAITLASRLHKNRGHIELPSGPTVHSLYCDTTLLCESCDSLKNGHYFIYIPLKQQIYTTIKCQKSRPKYALHATPANPIKGVKGMSVADLIPSFDTVKGTVICILLYACCLPRSHEANDELFGLWLDSKHHGEDFYIGSKVKSMDGHLQQISPPSEIHESPRSVYERCYWKAMELRAFIFYSVIVLHGILPRNYLHRFFIFVFGIYTLSGDSISSSAIDLSEVCLTKFEIQMEDLYGLTNCKYNVHCLTHLEHWVPDCGPLWATSAFAFELHYNMLINMFHGIQIADTFLLKAKISFLTSGCVNGDSCPSVKEVLSKLKFKDGLTPIAILEKQLP